MTSEPFYLQQIKQVFEEKRKKNAQYSTRALARDLSIDPGLLSSILRKKRIPSRKVAELLAQTMKFDQDKSWVFLRSIEEQRRFDKELKAGKIKKFEDIKPLQITHEQFEKISQWYHTAITTMTQLDDFECTPQSISKRLGISVTQASQALDDLKSVGVIYEDASGGLKAKDQITLVDRRDTTNHALKEHQKQILGLSQKAIDQIDYGKRFHTGYTLAIDPEKLPEARKIMEEFMLSLGVFLESGRKKKVYQFSMSLFPLEGKEDENEEISH